VSGRRLLPVALVAGVLIAGCGGKGSEGSGEDPDREAGQQVGTVQTVDCPADATPVDLPSGFSAPLPQGTVVVDVRKASERRTVVTGVVPSAEKDVLDGLHQAYASAGLTLTSGETEERDAESNFTGAGVKGRWGIRELSNCSPVATRIDVVIAPD
jgi:hypothetical protein